MAELILSPEDTVRVHADISRDAEYKLRLRALQLQRDTGTRVTRKAYLEKLILDDVAKVEGASKRELRSRQIRR